MCMVLYVGSEEQLPFIPYKSENPAFNTRKLNEQEEAVVGHFSLPHIIYAGSNEGCGCSFRHALYDNHEWCYFNWEEEENVIATQKDHQALTDYLEASNLKNFEIYACWDGDFAFQTACEEEITLEQISMHDFFFKERAHYKIAVNV